MFWISKHGSACGNEYANVSSAAKQAWWAQVESALDGIMFDSSKHSLNETTIGELVAGLSCLARAGVAVHHLCDRARR